MNFIFLLVHPTDWGGVGRLELARVLVSVSGEKGINNKARFIIVVILSA
jgi:hypothetical protein